MDKVCTGQKGGQPCPLKEQCAKYKPASNGVLFEAPFQINESGGDYKVSCPEFQRSTNEDVSDLGPDSSGGGTPLRD